jgi:uncharacterized membrane protein YgcG
VAPIALYPDSLVSQILIASGYPVQVVEAYQWLQKNKTLTGAQAETAAQANKWDPSVASLVQFPQVVERMFGNLEWTQDLGEAFIAQQKDVMDAIQVMRKKAYDAGNLKSSPQQNVAVDGAAIVVQPADPQVVYVESYSPTVVYGTWAPPVWYYPQAVYAPWPGWVPGSSAIAFGAGVAVGAAWGHAWGCSWATGHVTVNNNYYNHGGGTNPNGRVYSGANGSAAHYGNTTATYNKNTGEVHTYNSATGNTHSGNTSNWEHDASQRQGQPYSNSSLNNKYTGGASDAARGYGGSEQSAARETSGAAERSASDRGWSSRENSAQRSGGFSGGGGGGFNRGGGFSRGGGRR